MVNRIDSLISLPDVSFLVYRNASDFCVLTLYPAILLNSPISSSNFLILSLGFSITVSCHLQTVRAFLLYFFWISFIYFFPFLIAVARTSKTMLNKSGESGHPCLVPDIRGNAFSFSPLRIMFAVGLSHGLYSVEVGSFYAHVLKSFNHKWVLNCVTDFFCIY